jgi:N4-gp56 family major capsid protein
MATTLYTTNNALAVKLWAKKLAVEALKQTWVTKFIGKDSGSLVQIKDETSKGPGDKITYGLRMQLTGAGTQGDGTLEGNEEALTTYTDAIVIDQLRHAVRSAGKMSQQRVTFDVRQEALDGLVDWWSDRMDYSFFNQICGNTVQNDTRFTGLQAAILPDTGTGGHYRNSFSSSSVKDDDITSSYPFNLNMIDYAVERARTLTPAIRPIKMAGKDWYVVFIHPYQVTSMRTNTSTGQFLDIQKAAETGGLLTKNPIFDGSLGVYNNTIIHADYRVSQGVSINTAGTAISTVRRSVFAGAQAAMCAYGRNGGPERFEWNEELFDYGNQLGVEAGCIFGLKKTVFNSADFAQVTIPTYATAS